MAKEKKWVIYSVISPKVRTKIGVFYATNENSALYAARQKFQEWKYPLDIELVEENKS